MVSDDFNSENDTSHRPLDDDKSGQSLANTGVLRSPFAAIVLDATLHILEVNGAARKLLSLPHNDIIQKSITSFIHQDDVDSFSSGVRNLAENEVLEQELSLNAGNGSSPYIGLTLYRQNGLWLMWLNDLSELKALGVQLKNQKLPLRKFLHDIGNALTAAVGYSDLVTILLDKNSVLSKIEIKSLRNYHEEILKSLNKSEKLIREVRWQDMASEDNQSKNIMIVDDDAAIAKLLTELMKQENHKVQTFTDSEQALEYFAANSSSVDLVISDQFMPKLSGIELATEMRTIVKELPFIICTGDVKTIEQQMDGELNIQHFISKPIDIGEALNLVRKIFRNQ